MSYCTVDEVLQRMGHPGATDTNLTANVEAAIVAATAQIDQDTSRTFTAGSGARTFAVGSRHYVIAVDDFSALTSLKLDDDDDGVFETTISAGDLEIRKSINHPDWPYNRIALLDRSFPYPGRRMYRIEVTATWGWAAVPAPINQACSLMAARIAERTKSALFGVQSFGELGASTIRSNDPDYRNLIGPYVRPQVA